MSRSKIGGVRGRSGFMRVSAMRRAAGACALAFALCASSTTASASAYAIQEYASAEGLVATCWYKGLRYSEGAVVKMGDGWKTCLATGIWG